MLCLGVPTSGLTDRVSSARKLNGRLPHLLSSRPLQAQRHVCCMRERGAERIEPDRPVFELQPPRGAVTIFDARDAIETCAGLEGEAAEACYAVFGCDSEQTPKWYPSVSKLEAALAIPDEDNDQDETEDDNLNPWHLPSPLDEMVAMWQDAAEAIVRSHNASAQ